MKDILFVLDGRSGSGKSAMQEYVEKNCAHVNIVPRYSTLQHQHKPACGSYVDKLEVTEEQFEALEQHDDFHSYLFDGHHIGFSLKAITQQASPAALLIIRDVNSIERVRSYGRGAGFRVVAIYIRATIEKCKQNLMGQGHNRKSVMQRIGRDGKLYSIARERSGIYDEILVNSSDLRALCRSFKRLINKYGVDTSSCMD